MSFSDRRKDGSEGRGVERRYTPFVQTFCSWMPFLLPTSAKCIHWNSFFLPPPTEYQNSEIT